jgi:hypothetical protein
MRETIISKFKVMRAMFLAERNHACILKHNPPPLIRSMVCSTLEQKREALFKAGISEDEYRRFKDDYWLAYESREVESECRARCLVMIRSLQEYQKSNHGVLPPPPWGCCNDSPGTTCGPLCRYYSRATDEQFDKFEYMRDINTGDPLDGRAKPC